MKVKHHYRVVTELDFGEYSRKLEMPEISKVILIAAVYCDIKTDKSALQKDGLWVCLCVN